MKIWSCKIGEVDEALLPEAADIPMRAVVAREYERLTGKQPKFIFSGWGAELTEPERAVVENRLPSAEYEAQWHKAAEAPVGTGWIPVSEWLPERDGMYLALREVDHISELCAHVFDSGQWRFGDGSNMDALVTHWMPLPEAPVESGKVLRKNGCSAVRAVRGGTNEPSEYCWCSPCKKLLLDNEPCAMIDAQVESEKVEP